MPTFNCPSCGTQTVASGEQPEISCPQCGAKVRALPTLSVFSAWGREDFEEVEGEELSPRDDAFSFADLEDTLL